MNFSPWFAHQKRRQRLTFAQLAEMGGVHITTVQGIAAGRAPSMPTAEALAAGLGFAIWPTVDDVLEELAEYSKAELIELGVYYLRSDRRIAHWSTYANACDRLNFQIEMRKLE